MKILTCTGVCSVGFKRALQFIGGQRCTALFCRCCLRASLSAQMRIFLANCRKLVMTGIAAIFSCAVDNDFEQPGPVVDDFGQFLQTDLRTGFLQQRVGVGGRSVLAFERHAVCPADKQFGLCKTALGKSFLNSALQFFRSNHLLSSFIPVKVRSHC
ncbi:hypothetical protein [Brucella intermedia]|uniref:hypothetical protein n=1 Tax=Brucella intermedia TaxID=94625 RepID=UPI00178C20D4|nr:hypothetical protein [Brucella intermedia]